MATTVLYEEEKKKAKQTGKREKVSNWTARNMRETKKSKQLKLLKAGKGNVDSGVWKVTGRGVP